MQGIPLQDHHISLLSALKPFLRGKSPKMIDSIINITQRQAQISEKGINTVDALKGDISEAMDNAFIMFLILILLLATQGLASNESQADLTPKV